MSAALAGDAQADSLKHAKAYLHQAHGALQMVDVEGVGVFTAAAEAVLDRADQEMYRDKAAA